jgi:hypothetical protein
VLSDAPVRWREVSSPARPGRTRGLESCGDPMRDELLAIEQFDTLLKAQVIVAEQLVTAGPDLLGRRQ